MTLLGMECCGWKELHGLCDYRGNLNGVIRDLMNDSYTPEGAGAILFTSAGKDAKYAETFAKDLVAANLGTVSQLPRFRNPNSGNRIKTFVWLVSHRKLKAYCKKHKLVDDDPYW